jgi:hypothetical protein
MNLVVKLTSTHEWHEGDEVGLIQNLISSRRVATYENGGTLTILPAPENRPCPILDGDDRIEPWFSATAEGKKLPDNRSEFITLSMKDGPEFKVPKTANLANGSTTKFLKLKVEEHFVIYLHNNTTGENYKQWKWSYRYKVKNRQLSNESYVGPIEVAVKGDPIFSGPVAGEELTNKWSPGLSHPHWR